MVARDATDPCSIWHLVFIQFLYIFSVALTAPVFPFIWSTTPLADGAEDPETRGATLYAYAGFVNAFCEFMTFSFLGAVSDKVGRRPLLLLAFLGQVIDFGTAGLAAKDSEAAWVLPSAHIWLYTSRTLAGVCGSPGLFTRMYVGDVSREGTNGANNFAKLIATIGLSFVVGPPVGAILGSTSGRRSVMLLASGANLLGMVWICGFLPESLREEHKKSLDWSKANPFGMLQFLFSTKFLMFFGLASLLDQLTLTTLNTVFFQYLEKVFNTNQRQASGMLATFGICQALAYRFIMRPLVNNRGEILTLKIGYMISCLTLLSFAVAGQFLTSQPSVVYIVMMFLGIGAISNPAEYALAARCVGKDEQGKLQAATGSFDVIGKMLANAGVALIYERSVAAGAPGAIWLFAAVCLSPAVYFAFQLRGFLPSTVLEAHVKVGELVQSFSALGEKVAFLPQVTCPHRSSDLRTAELAQS